MPTWQDRYDRAAHQIDAAHRQRRLTQFRCESEECGALLGYYEPPIFYLYIKCRRCGLYSALSIPGSNGAGAMSNQ